MGRYPEGVPRGCHAARWPSIEQTAPARADRRGVAAQSPPRLRHLLVGRFLVQQRSVLEVPKLGGPKIEHRREGGAL